VLEIKDTTDKSASYLDLHLEIESEGRLRTKPYNKRNDFNFPIVTFSFICTNIPTAPANGVYMIDSDRRSASNRRPLLKSASTDVIISNHGPILGYSQIGVLSKLSYL
jgi:hypothetical protein